ncbi:uncharacterized protein M7BP isoform X2 [Calliphora vicina]|uniref:uncharacterized protein M7BP isoform X2 n=1 Tax=Calliphora vicina TaxID=7373 RepID=UPI00325B2A87
MSSSLGETVNIELVQSPKEIKVTDDSSKNFKHQQTVEQINSSKSSPVKSFNNSRSSDSGKSSSCSPILLDCSFDSGIAGVLLDSNDMQIHKRIQQCQCILLALERDREYYCTIRNRLSKITNRKKKPSNENEFFCNVCCADIDPEDDKTFVKCYICQKYICRSIKCADWLPKTAEWECELCQTSKESLAQTSSWVADQISFHQEKLIHPPRARSEIYIPISECNDSSIHFESVSQIGANSTMVTAEQKLKIREYVEEVVAKLLGGNLDTIAVNQLSKSENYLNLFHKYHSKLSNILINLENVLTFYTHNKGDLPDPKIDLSHNGISKESVRARASNNDFTDISETRLRQMIQKIIAETISLPPLSKSHAVSEIALDRRSKSGDSRPLTNGYNPRHRTEHYFEPIIYQDLLATAVLNKIVDTKLNNNHEVSESDSGGGDGINDNIRHAVSDHNLNIEKLSTSSGSSVEPRSDCSYPEIDQTNDDKSSELIRNSDRDSVMSDYLASHMIPLPDLNAMATESDEDDYMSVTSSAVGDGTWEKNWLFKKKKSALSNSVTANSVGMLVPDPKEDVRAQIGDKTADEVSDLSELGSDTDDSLDSLRSKLEPINDRLINKHLIGGQNNKMVLDELIERSSMISNTLQSSQDPSYTDACNEHVIDGPVRNEAINDNVTQQVSALEQKGDILRAALCSVVLEDPNSNSITETNAKANTNHNNTNNHKQPITNMSGDSATTTTFNQMRPCYPLTSAVQNNETSSSHSQCVQQLIRNDHVNVQILTDARDLNNIDGVGVYSDGDGDRDDGVINDNEEDDDVAIMRHFLPGSIAEREYKKWYNAVEMPNNPYAPEALKRRISGSQERFIDLPNISPTKDLNPLDLLDNQKLDADENMTRESDYKRYSRDYYINSSLTTPQLSPARDVSAHATNKDIREPTKKTLSSTENETDLDLYKAIPAQVVENNSSSTDVMSPLSGEMEGNTTTTSDDSDTIKMYDFKTQQETIKDTTITHREQARVDEINSKERPSSLAFSRSESGVNIVTPTRGSTPMAFKFLQPKRKLLEPNQVLSVEENEPQIVSSPSEKPVIEAEVAKALPSVKALARAFLMTTKASQPEKIWLRKARTLSQGGNKRSYSPKRSLDHLMKSERSKPEDDITITSDLSSLETDSSSIGIEIATTSDVSTIGISSTNDPSLPTDTGSNISPVPVRQGVLKNNIAFFENLKNK